MDPAVDLVEHVLGGGVSPTNLKCENAGHEVLRQESFGGIAPLRISLEIPMDRLPSHVGSHHQLLKVAIAHWGRERSPVKV